MITLSSLYTRVALVALAVFSFAAFAQGATPPTGDEIVAFVQSLANVKGSMAIVLAVVQGLALILRFSALDKVIPGNWRLTIILLLTYVGAGIAGLAGGQTFVQAFLSGTAMAALQVLGNQVWKQFFTAKGKETAKSKASKR